jgi:NADP-dependent 3-hydroxy acid dehydrogenase YdfG
MASRTAPAIALSKSKVNGDERLPVVHARIALGKGFLNQDFNDPPRMADTHVTGTVDLLQHIGIEVRRHRAGKVVTTGSITGGVPGRLKRHTARPKTFLKPFHSRPAARTE